MIKRNIKRRQARGEKRLAAQNTPDSFITVPTSKLLQHQAGSRQETEYNYKQILRKCSDNANALYYLGNMFRDLGKLDDAVTCYQRALIINPDSAELHYNLGVALYLLGKINAAAASYQRALTINRHDADAHYNLGIILKDQGRLDQAVFCYQRAIAIRPNFSEAHNNLGMALFEQGKFDTAGTSFRRAVELDPNNVSAKHMQAALTGQMTKTMPHQLVKSLFDKYATGFDRHLSEKLKYKGPSLLRQGMKTILKDTRRFRNAIDLGCGTGLAGKEFRDISDRLTGIDISSRMLEGARRKNIYDVLYSRDIIKFLTGTEEKYDLFIAADVFVYFGDLEIVFNAVEKCSLPGAYFGFTSEHTDQDNFILRQTGRYAHNEKYIQALAREHNFICEMCCSDDIRKENRQWITGDLFIFRLKDR